MKLSQLKRAVEARLNVINGALSKLPDEAAVDVAALFEQWMPDKDYVVDQRLQYNDKLYRVVQSHHSQANWTPDIVPALFTEVAKPGEIAEWRQPTGAQDAYHNGDKVTHNGFTWVSTIDNNVWEPGVYGWNKVE